MDALINCPPFSTVRGSGWPGLNAHSGVRRVLSAGHPLPRTVRNSTIDVREVSAVIHLVYFGDVYSGAIWVGTISPEDVDLRTGEASSR